MPALSYGFGGAFLSFFMVRDAIYEALQLYR